MKRVKSIHRFVDHSSVNVIARAILENFIVFEWVFGPEDESLSHFRYKTWVAAGLKDRVDAPTFSDTAKSVQARELLQFIALCDEIKADQHFKTISAGAQKQLLKGNWRMGRSIEEIATQLGFHSRTFGALYSYLCSYSHSSYVAALQMGQAEELGEKRLARMSLGVAANMTARIILTYARLFPLANDVLTSSTEKEKSAVTRWDLKRENFEPSYGVDPATTPRQWKDGRPVKK